MSSKPHSSAKLLVHNECAGYLVFSEPYYPGWHVSVDGVEVPVLRANYAYSAIFLPEGGHEIRRWYRPDALLLGLLGSFISMWGVFLIVWKKREWLE